MSINTTIESAIAARAAPTKPNRDLLFWSLHAMGWSGYGIAQYLGGLLYSKPVEYMKVILIASVAGFLLTAPLRYYCRWLWERGPATMIGGGLAMAYAIALVLRVIINWSYERYVEPEWPMVHWYDFTSGAMSATYLCVCWMGLYFGFRYYESMHMQREAALRSSALAQEAQLKMLRYQLNPHFLFNTLNAISTLILDNRNSVANGAVTGLSDFLRYTLDQDPMKKVTVAKEMDALTLYTNIEKMRFGDRLMLDYDVRDEALDMLIPSLLLQPLIENAVKYAVSPREAGGRIDITARVEGAYLHLAVADDGPGMVDPSKFSNGRGVGIRNTRERLQVLYGDASHVRVTNAEPGLRVELTLPAERAS